MGGHPADLDRADRPVTSGRVARVKADEEYRRVALENLARDSSGASRSSAWHAACSSCGPAKSRSVTATINRLPPLDHPPVLGGASGHRRSRARRADRGLARHGRVADGVWLAAPIVYVTAVHFPLLTEARQSLPAQPVLLAARRPSGVVQLTGHSFARRTAGS